MADGKQTRVKMTEYCRAARGEESDMAREMKGSKILVLDPLLKDEEKKGQARLLPSYRLAISLLSFCGLFLSSLSQSAMGATIAYMVTNETHNDMFETFNWDKTTQGWVFSSRFLACYLVQLPSGYLTSYVSCRTMAAIGLVAMGFLDVMTVPCAKNILTLLLVRTAQGCANALVTTGCYGILGKWMPSHETSLLLGFAGTGFFSGSFPMFLISSLFCETPSLGWPCVFYLSGGLPIAFSIVWYTFAESEPKGSRWVGKEEKSYIIACKKHESVCRKVPLRAMLTSGPMYGIACAQISQEWLQYFGLTVAPAFFTDILHFSHRQADLVCGFPYLLAIPVCMMFGRCLDGLRQYRVLSTIGIRRLAQCVGNLVPAVCCLVLALLPASNGTGHVTAFFICVVTFICTTCGWTANVSDLAPQNTGAAFAVSQTLAAWVSFVVPVFVSYLTAQKTKGEWNTVFYITTGVQVISFVGFCILGSGDVQPWARSEERMPPDDSQAEDSE